MMEIFINWLLTSVSLLAVAYLIKGFEVEGLGSAFLAAILIGLVNGTLGFVLKLLTLPLTILSFGLFLLVINALMLKLVAWVVPGFKVQGFLPAFLGALVLAVLNSLLRFLVFG